MIITPFLIVVGASCRANQIERNVNILSPRARFSSQSAVNLASATHPLSSDEDESDEEEEEESPLVREQKELEPLKFKNFEVNQLRSFEEDGRLILRPFYQRGYKWTQKQASLWIESILRGYPCLPEVTLVQTMGKDGETQYATFDGQQRLTSTLSFVKNERGDHWRKTKKQEKKNLDASFALEGLTILKDKEDMTFKDLSKREQNAIRDYDIRCAIIPDSWAMEDYIEFFKRIQGGGTPMSDHELRRALARGPFTDLLDELAGLSEVKEAFRGCTMAQDDIQQLLLRYFSLTKCDDAAKYGKPSAKQQGLETMKRLNREMEAWEAQESVKKREDLVEPLLSALKLATEIFHTNEPFRRPAPLIKNGTNENPTKVWNDATKVSDPIFLCIVYCLSRDDIMKWRLDLLKHREAVRTAMLDVMQTEPAFTDSLNIPTTAARLRVMTEKLHSLVSTFDGRDARPISPQTRLDLIKNARISNPICPLCKQPLSKFDDHLHIDHILPRARGGTNDLDNLQVVHKTCNLRKGANK